MSTQDEQPVGSMRPDGGQDGDGQAGALVPIPQGRISSKPQQRVTEGVPGDGNPFTPPPRVESASISHVHEEVRVSVGVLTDPKSLAEYEAVAPGSATKILEKFFEQVTTEQKHRHAMDQQLLATEKEHETKILHQGDRGQWMALTVALAGFVLVAWLAHIDKSVLAGLIGSLDLLGLVSVFIYGRKKQSEETLSEKSQADQDQGQSGISAKTRASSGTEEHPG